MHSQNGHNLSKSKRLGSLIEYVELSGSSSDTTSSRSSVESLINEMDNTPPIKENESESDNEDFSESDCNDKIWVKEKEIEEIDLRITELQDRKKNLVADCNRLKDEKALRQSHKLAKQNWDSGKL